MRVTAVGGYKAVGRNMTGVTVGKETIALDNGIRLDTLQMYDDETDRLSKAKLDELVKLDIVPEYRRLKNVKAQVISHGHLDHIGALPLTKPRVPIISTHYSAEIGRREYREGDFYSTDFGEHYTVSDKFKVELVEVTHSIPYSSIVVLHTPEGNVVYASDFKFDDHASLGKTDYKRLGQIGGKGVKALIAESTRVGESGKTQSEKIAKEKIREVFQFLDDCDGLITATTFSTHIERIQTILDEAESLGRIPLILGKSMFNNTSLAEKFNILDTPSNARFYVKIKAVSNALREMRNRRDYLLLVTGHQAEPESVLSRMVDGQYHFRFQKKDAILFCANVIPSPVNEANRSVMESKLHNLGVRIFKNLHVSGHASMEDHRKLISMLKPQHIIPCHGSLRMRGDYVRLASEEGYDLNKNIHLINNGQDVEV